SLRHLAELYRSLQPGFHRDSTAAFGEVIDKLPDWKRRFKSEVESRDRFIFICCSNLFKIGIRKRRDSIQRGRLESLFRKPTLFLLERCDLIVIYLFYELAIIDSQLLIAAHINRLSENRINRLIELASCYEIFTVGVGF